MIVAHVMDAMHALPSRQHVVVKYQSGCVVVVVALIVAACGHASPRQLPARTWRRNEEKNKQTYKQALPFLSKERQTTDKLQEATNEKQNFLHTSSFFVFLSGRQTCDNKHMIVHSSSCSSCSSSSSSSSSS